MEYFTEQPERNKQMIVVEIDKYLLIAVLTHAQHSLDAAIREATNPKLAELHHNNIQQIEHAINKLKNRE